MATVEASKLLVSPTEHKSHYRNRKMMKGSKCMSVVMRNCIFLQL